MRTAAREIVMVMARADNGVIGRDGGLPWRLSADLRRFKALTLGAPMIMGRKTFAGLPGLLPGRRHIVLTRDADWRAEGAEPAANVDQALALAGEGTVMVIGGAEIYALFLPHAHRIELTEVHMAADGDTSIAYPDPMAWQEIARADHAAVQETPAYSFVTFRHINAV